MLVDLTGAGDLAQSSFGGFTVLTFTEAESPELARAAQRMQAASYVHMGYVTPEALDQDGRLSEDLDHARGDAIKYLVALGPDCSLQASCRFGHADPEGDLFQLASWGHIADAMVPAERARIEALHKASDVSRVLDCSALCRRPGADPTAVYVLLRQAIHASIQDEHAVEWIMGLTTSTYASIRGAFGRALRRTGYDVPPAEGDPRITAETRLVPSAATIRDVPRLVLEEFEQSIDPIARSRLQRTLALVTVGLEDEALGADSETVSRIRRITGTKAPR